MWGSGGEEQHILNWRVILEEDVKKNGGKKEWMNERKKERMSYVEIKSDLLVYLFYQKTSSWSLLKSFFSFHCLFVR